MNPLLSFSSGVVAAFTPCVVVLFPVLLYRFFHKDQKHYVSFGLFTIGFLLLFIVLGYGLGSLFTSFFQNGFKVALGLLFIVLAVLSLLDRINPLDFPVIRNPLLLGMVFALALTFNPCTLPYLGVLVSASSALTIVADMLLFGLGLIAPALAFAFFGSRVMDIAKTQRKHIHAINKIMSIILLLAGVYMIMMAVSFMRADLYAVAIMLVLIFILLLRSYYLVLRPADLKSPRTIILVVALFLIVLAAIIHCELFIGAAAEHLSCSIGGIQDCEVCQRCVLTFSIALILGAIGMFLSYRARFFRKGKDI